MGHCMVISGDCRHQDKKPWLSSWALLSLANETRPGERPCQFSLLVNYWQVSWYSFDSCQQLWSKGLHTGTTAPNRWLLSEGKRLLMWGDHAGKICFWWQKGNSSWPFLFIPPVYSMNSCNWWTAHHEKHLNWKTSSDPTVGAWKKHKTGKYKSKFKF